MSNQGPNKVTYKLISKSKATSNGKIIGGQIVQIVDWGDEVRSNTMHMKLSNGALHYKTNSEHITVQPEDVKGW